MPTGKRPRSEPHVDAVDATDVLYRRTLRTLVSVVAEKELPGRVLRGGHAIDGSYFFTWQDGKSVTSEDVKMLTHGLQALIASDIPIESTHLPYGEAVAYFEKREMAASLALIKSRVTSNVDVHSIAGTLRLAIFPLVTSTGKASPCPHLMPYQDGLLVVFHNSDGPLASFVPSPTLTLSFKDHKAWGDIHGTHSVGHLNQLKAVGREFHDFVLHAEFRQEAKLALLAQTISRKNDSLSTSKDRIGVICIAGPTSSGKTTFANKLAMYLANAGYHAVPLTVDHYYLPLDRQPKYQARQLRSDVDYDAIEAMDLDLVNEQVNALLRGEEVLTPVYNMKTGYRDGKGKPFRLRNRGHSILVLEGIHSLNPSYTSSVTECKVFRIYISPLSALQIDETNAIRTTDHRLLRRMCRDFLFRGHDASRTLSMWDNVRRGEHRWIFPHQDNVDWVMNSGMEYELRVLKPFVEPLLAAVEPSDAVYPKAQALLRMLSLVNSASSHIVPSASLLREFIGDGAFDFH